MLLHIIPNTANHKDYSDTGGTKGIKIFYEYFKYKNIDYEDLVAPNRSDKELLKILKNKDLTKYSDIFVHYTSFVGSCKYIKRKYPNINLIIRSHNAEFPHWIHHSLSWLKYGNLIEAIKLFLISFIKLRGDIISSRVGDYLLVITPWELDNYWNLFPNKCKFLYIPYFSPESFIEKTYNKLYERDLICTCLLSTNKSPFLIDAAQNFQNLVESLENKLPDWTFKISGNNDGIKRSQNKNIIFTGIVDDPIKLQKDSKAIAVLSDYGFGFKTKILEAIENNCFVLVSSKLHSRLPPEVKKNCIKVDIQNNNSFEYALKSLESITNENSINQSLKDQAFKNLEQALLKF